MYTCEVWNENEAEHKEKKNTDENYQDSHAVRSKAQTAQETIFQRKWPKETH